MLRGVSNLSREAGPGSSGKAHLGVATLLQENLQAADGELDERGEGGWRAT